MNPNAVRPGASFFSPLPPPPPSPFPRSLGRIQTKRHLCWLASLPRDPDDCSPPPPLPPPFPSTSSCSSYQQRQSCLGSEKLICSTDELHRSARLSANMDVVVNGGGDLKYNDREGRCTSVCVCMCVCVSGSKFAYVHLRFL